jgi:hypothetical protein
LEAKSRSRSPDGFAQRSGSVDLFAAADEADLEVIKFSQDVDEVFYAAGQPVGGPDQDKIELMTASVAKHLVQTRPAGLCPADAVVGERLYHFETALRGQLLEIQQLGRGVLV